MVIFLLFITLQAGPRDEVTLGGTHPYFTLEDCQTDGKRMMNWLSQPDVSVGWTCQRIEKRGTKASTESVG